MHERDKTALSNHQDPSAADPVYGFIQNNATGSSELSSSSPSLSLSFSSSLAPSFPSSACNVLSYSSSSLHSGVPSTSSLMLSSMMQLKTINKSRYPREKITTTPLLEETISVSTTLDLATWTEVVGWPFSPATSGARAGGTSTFPETPRLLLLRSSTPVLPLPTEALPTVVPGLNIETA
nr:hypothetical protein Iba_chr07dCG12620 [Ipomoea batatas]